MRPYFSFVIPSKNRARYLRHAIRSCLSQSFTDFEVVVSDNNSTDDTRSCCESFKDDRIVYCNPGVDLSLTDNFENGLKSVNGNYVLFLADDEVYRPQTLAALHGVIEQTSARIVSFGRTARYVWPGADADACNVLRVAPFTGKTAVIDSESQRRRLITGEAVANLHTDYGYINRALPLSVKTVIQKDIIDRVIARTGRFHHRAPDWSSCLLSLCEVDTLAIYDRHLNMAGMVAESGGPAYAKKGTFDKQTNADLLALNSVPVKAPLFSNVISDSIQYTKTMVSPQCDNLHLDPTLYTYNLLRDLYTWKENGIDIKEMLAEVRGYISDNKVTEHNGFLYHFDTKRRWKPGYIAYLLKKRRQAKSNSQALSTWSRAYDGETYGFHDVDSCMNFYDNLEPDLLGDEQASQMFEKYFPTAKIVENSIEGFNTT